jgi:hypothetical protein
MVKAMEEDEEFKEEVEKLMEGILLLIMELHRFPQEKVPPGICSFIWGSPEEGYATTWQEIKWEESQNGHKGGEE